MYVYAFNDPFPYAYALIPVLTPNLIPKYLFYNCSLFKFKKPFEGKTKLLMVVHYWRGGGLGRLKIYHAPTTGAFN